MTDERGLVEQARRLEEQGYEAFKEGDADRSHDLNARSLALAREAADPEAIARALPRIDSHVGKRPIASPGASFLE